MNVQFLNIVEHNIDSEANPGKQEVSTQRQFANSRERRQFANEVYSEIATGEKLHPVRDSRAILSIARRKHPAMFDVPYVPITMPGKQK